MESTETVVVYCGGFLTPEGQIPYSPGITPKNVRPINVYPSGVASLHDRVMQIFYELKGGQVRYGLEHSRFHGHSELGMKFETGKYPQWDENHPINFVGHSFGGLTAIVLQNYLADGDKFAGYKTNLKWIRSVCTISSPLNGCLMTYSLGANEAFPNVVRWAAVGCFVGWIAHIAEYMDSPSWRATYDFKLGNLKSIYFIS